MFQFREKFHHNLRYKSEFINQPIRLYHGIEAVSYLGTKVWELIPPVIRQIDTFSGFKKAIKKNENPLTTHAGFAEHTYLV